MKESTIEQYLVRRCKAEGIQCYKFVSPSNRGVPDRVLIFPHGKVVFVELKAPGKKPTPLQETVMSQIRQNYAAARWTDSKDGVDAILRTYEVPQ